VALGIVIQLELDYNLFMRRWFSVATLSLILLSLSLSLPVWAQRHGGGSSSGSHMLMGSGGVHSAGSFHASNLSHGSSIRLQGSHSNFNHSDFRRRDFNGRRFFYPYGYYPYYGWYSDSGYTNENDGQDQDAYAESYNPVPYRKDDGLQHDVQALSGKIDRLQADVEARNRPKPDMEPATALVFRDRHVEEVRNYAISGGTLWVLNDQAAKKIPLAQLDLDATVKMNDDRGVDFQVPR
jgi:hypothetical protein